VRRHAPTTKAGDGRGAGSSLSRSGVVQARRLGDSAGPFGYVVAGDVSRSAETALAMGFAVDEIVDMGTGVWEDGQLEKGHDHAHWDWSSPRGCRRCG
jgi:broad specificity phosphatase PhoE